MADKRTEGGGSTPLTMEAGAKSDDLDTHTRTDTIKIHRAELGADGGFARADEMITMQGEPGHDALCAREQDFVLDAIVNNVDLSRHMDDAVQSLRVCLAADESVRTGQAVRL